MNPYFFSSPSPMYHPTVYGPPSVSLYPSAPLQYTNPSLSPQHVATHQVQYPERPSHIPGGPYNYYDNIYPHSSPPQGYIHHQYHDDPEEYGDAPYGDYDDRPYPRHSRPSRPPRPSGDPRRNWHEPQLKRSPSVPSTRAYSPPFQPTALRSRSSFEHVSPVSHRHPAQRGPPSPSTYRQLLQQFDDLTPARAAIPTPCFACGKHVTEDNFLGAEGRSFHLGCLRCKACNTVLGPQAPFHRHGDVYYCTPHFDSMAITQKCVYCDRALPRGSRPTNIYGEQICPAHRDCSHITDCQDCGRIVPARSAARNSRFATSTSRIQCDVCQHKALTDARQAVSLFAQVRAVLEREYNLSDLPNPPLHLMPISQLQKSGSRIHGGGGRAQIGGLTHCRDVGGSFVVEWIGVPSGLNGERLAMIMAHELLHAYMFEHNFPLHKLGLKVEEGLCELAAYCWMTCESNRGKPLYDFWRDQMMSGTNAVYHKGFHAAARSFEIFSRKYGKANALPHLLHYVFTNKCLPTR